MSINEMNNKIIGKWLESVNDEDKRVGMQLLELCIEMDSGNEWELLFCTQMHISILSRYCLGLLADFLNLYLTNVMTYFLAVILVS